MSKLILSQICHMLGLESQENLPAMPFTAVEIDSRKVGPGHLFVALKGQKYDGHAFLLEVEKRGALAAIVDIKASCPDVKIPLIRVEDPLKAMQQMAKAHAESLNAKVIAVTGSLGKTMTKDFIFSLLNSKYKTMVTTGNQNSQVGLALSILNNCTGNEEYLVLEMAMTEPGQIRRLVEIVPPDIAVVTFISLVHAENFDTIKDIARAKMEIFSHPKTSLGIVNLDSPCSELLTQGSCKGACKKLGYSMEMPTADMRLELFSDSLCFYESSMAFAMPFISLPATHVYSCMLAACTVARACNMSWNEIELALPLLKLPPARLQFIDKHGITFIDDSYNASEHSLKGALTVLQNNGTAKRKIAVIGEMGELGKYSQSCHASVGKWALDRADIMVCLGKECEPIIEIWQSAHRAVFWFLQFEDLLWFLKQELECGDVVLLKGANKNGLWRILNEFV